MVAYKKPQEGRKKKAKRQEEREIRLSLLILDLKDGKLQDSEMRKSNIVFEILIKISNWYYLFFPSLKFRFGESLI